MPTPVVYGDYLYTCSNQGVLTAYNAKTGERVYQERLGGKGGAFTASPVASDGKIYLSSEDGDVFVVKAGPKYELLATNPVGEVLMATPAISEGLVIVRGVKHIYAFGARNGSKPR
jgi:outer membrane protein assembly factor BamB